jgi:ankyrin repeat protein
LELRRVLTNNINDKDKDGHLEIVEELLVRGADINCKDSLGWIPLHDASCKGHLGIVNVNTKIEQGTSRRIENGYTPLHWASQYKFVKIAQLLIEYGADVNKKIIMDGRRYMKLHGTTH